MIHRIVRSVLGLPRRRCDSDVEHLVVPMRDGVRLATTHVWPIEAEGPTPTLLLRTPYGVETRPPITVWIGQILAEYGYHVVLQDVRGRYRSEGSWAPFVHEADDGADTLDWLEGQGWSDGPVGMLGASYLTHAAWAAATRRPKRIGSLALAIGSSDLHPLFYPHDNVFSFANAVEWAAGVGEREGIDLREVDLERAFAFEPVREADRVARKQVDFYRTWIDQPDRNDAYWREVDAGLPDPAPPTLLIAGFWDFFIEPQLADHQRLIARAREGHGAPPRLLIGPWAHGRTAHRRFWRDGMGRRTLAAVVAHFDSTLKHDDPPTSKTDAVRFFIGDPSGGGGWRSSEAWPPGAAQTHSFFLGTSEGRPALLDDAPIEQVRFEGVYDPLDPTPTIGGKLFGAKAGAKDQAPLASRPDVLCIQSAPLARDLVLAGPVRATLHVGADAAPFDFALHLIDATPGGAQWLVCDGLARGTQAQVDDDATRPLQISLAHAGWRFRAGHRIRLHIAPANCPRFARARPPSEADSNRIHESRHWIVSSATKPSRLELTLAPGERVAFEPQRSV
jgi:hypothetical protein